MRRSVGVGEVHYIGKESNRIEDVEHGLVHALGDVLNEYVDGRRDEWETSILPRLREISKAEIAGATGTSERQIQRYRTGRVTPRSKHRDALARHL